MRITRQAVLAARTCAICERTLLVGERSIRYSPNGEDFVDVCPLCQDEAIDHGWLKEGSPTTPVVSERRRRKRIGLGSLFEPRKPEVERVVDEPILRRLSSPLRPPKAGGRARRGGADPAPSLRARKGDGRGGRALQRQCFPPHR